jgi:hypothetical protein
MNFRLTTTSRSRVDHAHWLIWFLKAHTQGPVLSRLFLYDLTLLDQGFVKVHQDLIIAKQKVGR